ncbi:MAG: damage-inducible protein DinB [Hyphomicrobiales bacterium]|nr:MAG: damage-inducible protein DinB [Hyphomicrobiales bacterium]
MHQSYFQMFAAYNEWANTLLYDACEPLSDEARKKDRNSFFGSIHNTLNHLIVGDRVWMQRFTASGKTYQKLDQAPFEDWAALRAERNAEDARIISYVGALDDATLQGTFIYTPITTPETVEQVLEPALAHFFNHQTHHRGQVHCMLNQAGISPPALDILYYQHEMAAKGA